MPNREKNPVRQAMGKAGAAARWGKDYGGPSLDEFRNKEGKIPELQKHGHKTTRDLPRDEQGRFEPRENEQGHFEPRENEQGHFEPQN